MIWILGLYVVSFRLIYFRLSLYRHWVSVGLQLLRSFILTAKLQDFLKKSMNLGPHVCTVQVSYHIITDLGQDHSFDRSFSRKYLATLNQEILSANHSSSYHSILILDKSIREELANFHMRVDVSASPRPAPTLQQSISHLIRQFGQ